MFIKEGIHSYINKGSRRFCFMVFVIYNLSSVNKRVSSSPILTFQFHNRSGTRETRRTPLREERRRSRPSASERIEHHRSEVRAGDRSAPVEGERYRSVPQEKSRGRRIISLWLGAYSRVRLLE